MTRITSEVLINAPKNEVWDIIADLGAIENFHPGVTKSYYTSKVKNGVGASRHCDLLPAGSIEETATEWHEGEGYVLEVRGGEGLPPFKKAHIRLALKRDGHQTVATLSFEYTLKHGPIGKFLDVWKVRPMFRTVVPRVLAGLKQYSEAAETMAPAGLEPSKTAA